MAADAKQASSKRYRALLRDEISQTLAEPEQVDEELRSLLAALAG